MSATASLSVNNNVQRACFQIHSSNAQSGRALPNLTGRQLSARIRIHGSIVFTLRSFDHNNHWFEPFTLSHRSVKFGLLQALAVDQSLAIKMQSRHTVAALAQVRVVRVHEVSCPLSERSRLSVHLQFDAVHILLTVGIQPSALTFHEKQFVCLLQHSHTMHPFHIRPNPNVGSWNVIFSILSEMSVYTTLFLWGMLIWLTTALSRPVPEVDGIDSPVWSSSVPDVES